ncbi:hypothetical protein C8R47DRAFT_1213764 [Mycena vitilis]|nr:hypothetical protein C8R47DRAFT_1213764 [Mycena vitilis]
MALPSTNWFTKSVETVLSEEVLNYQFPNFLLKPTQRPDHISSGWDVCAARVFAPLTWEDKDHEHSPVVTLRASKRDGIYVNSKDWHAAFIPGRSWTKKHDNLADGLLYHFSTCHKSHPHCLERNILLAELRMDELEDSNAHTDEDDDHELVQFLEELHRAEVEFGIQLDGDADADGEDDEDADTDGETDGDLILLEAEVSLAEIGMDL